MTDQPTPQTDAALESRLFSDITDDDVHYEYEDTPEREPVLFVRWDFMWPRIKTAQARTEALDVEPALLTGVLRFYAEQMPAYAVAAGLNREEYAAVMVDVNRVRAILKADR